MKQKKVNNILLAVIALVVSTIACAPRQSTPTPYPDTRGESQAWEVKVVLSKVDISTSLATIVINVPDDQLPAALVLDVGEETYNNVIPNVQNTYSATLAEFAFAEIKVGDKIYVYDYSEATTGRGFLYYFKLK